MIPNFTDDLRHFSSAFSEIERDLASDKRDDDIHVWAKRLHRWSSEVEDRSTAADAERLDSVAMEILETINSWPLNRVIKSSTWESNRLRFRGWIASIADYALALADRDREGFSTKLRR